MNRSSFFSPGVGHAYDSVMLIHSVAQHATSRQDLLARFRSISAHDGVIGRLEVRGDGVILSDATVKVIRGGHPVVESR